MAASCSSGVLAQASSLMNGGGLAFVFTRTWNRTAKAGNRVIRGKPASPGRGRALKRDAQNRVYLKQLGLRSSGNSTIVGPSPNPVDFALQLKHTVNSFAYA